MGSISRKRRRQCQLSFVQRPADNTPGHAGRGQPGYVVGRGHAAGPAHPSANQDGYVTSPNVNALVEMMDMKEAQRSYEANLKVIENAKSMLMQTIALLRSS